MARIAGVDLPREKRIEISLQYIYGIGKTTAKRICEGAQVDPGLGDDLLRRGLADSVDVLERDLDALLAGKVDAGDASHLRCSPGSDGRGR